MIKEDVLGRRFKKLRVSLTHECNYACLYCSDTSIAHYSPISESKPIHLLENKRILSSIELIQLIHRLHQELDLHTVRLTGGEPMLYPNLLSVVAALKSIQVPNIAMTTNGHSFYSLAEQLKNEGLTSVNISIDGLDPIIFRKMSRRNGVENVLRSIDVAIQLGLVTKLNTVIMRGVNDSQILPLLDFAINKGIVIRFLELMPMGPLHQTYKDLFYSETEILEQISAKYPIQLLKKDTSSTARYWSVGSKTAFGIIANESTPFCSDCDRLRLDSYGNIYGCLSNLHPINVSKDVDSNLLKSSLIKAMNDKQKDNFKGNFKTMQSIGG
jgi:cyclic pyranopterin phosphate synthase